MRLSILQKYILKQCAQAKGKIISKSRLENFYKGKKPADAINIITKSAERLIKKELIVGFGEKTAHKWFIKQVKLTPKGRKLVRGLFGVQQQLPFKLRKLIQRVK